MHHAHALTVCSSLLLLSAMAFPQAPVAVPHGGDPEVVRFVRPVATAVARAKAERRLLFVKPVYGGMDADGADSYCHGQW